jgi:co-chaperonin GroES (HSP10)
VLTPTGRRVLIKVDNKPIDEKVGSLYLPQQRWSGLPDVNIATILAIGPKVTSSIKVNQKVIVSRLAGIKFDGNIIIDEEDIAAIMED